MFHELAPQIKHHMASKYPNEACGLIVDDGGPRFVPVRNVSRSPNVTFEVDPVERVRYDRHIVAVVHSHTNGNPAPTRDDMLSQVSSGHVFGLLTVKEIDGKVTASDPFYWGAGIPDVPLWGRVFRHGPSGTDNKGDCYAFIKDWYASEFNIPLPEMPRDDAWWLSGKADLYSLNYATAGFYQINKKDVRRGDVFMMALHSPKGILNHGGVYLGNNKIGHHVIRRYSREEPLGVWWHHATLWVRHKDAPS